MQTSRHLLEKGFAKATIASYVADVRIFYRHLGKEPTDADFTRFDLLDYKRQMVEGRSAVATINKRVNSLQAYNLFLIDKGYRQDLSVSMKRDRIKIASGSEGEVDVFTDEEVGKLLAYVADESKCSLRNRLIVHLLLYTGLRVSELCS